jgi:hypothetical protein
MVKNGSTLPVSCNQSSLGGVMTVLMHPIRVFLALAGLAGGLASFFSAQTAASAPDDAATVLTGTWNMSRPPLVLRIFGAESNQIQFTYREGKTLVTHSFPRDELQDSGDSRIVERAAGRLVLDGSVEDWLGSGDFKFTPSPAYAAQLTTVLGTVPALRDLFAVFLEKLPLDYIRAAAASLDAPKQGDILELRHHGVTTAYLQQVSAAGIRGAAPIVQLRIHGVPADFPSTSASAGYRYAPEDLVKLRIHGVSTSYANRWKEAGFNHSAEDLTRLCIHGVEPELGSALSEAARDVAASPAAFTVDELVQLRVHGFNPEQVREWTRAGFRWTSAELVRLRQHGVGVDHARATQVQGRPPLTADTLIELRQRGVSSDLARRMQP